MLAFTSELRKWITVCRWRHARTRRPCWRQWRCRAVSRPPHRRSSWDWTTWPHCCLTRVCIPRACQPHGLRNNTNALQSKSSLWKAITISPVPILVTLSVSKLQKTILLLLVADVDEVSWDTNMSINTDIMTRLTPPYSSHCAQASSQVFFVSEKRYLCRGWNNWTFSFVYLKLSIPT